MITINEATDRAKVIKILLEKWKKDVVLRQKAVQLLALHPLPKVKKIRGFQIP